MRADGSQGVHHRPAAAGARDMSDIPGGTTDTTTDAPLLSLRGFNKSFGAVQVLRGRDLDAWAGKVTALVGDNGAGKSTLIKSIAGIYSFDDGEYCLAGQPVITHS